MEEVDHPPLRCEVVEPFLGECGDELEATEILVDSEMVDVSGCVEVVVLEVAERVLHHHVS